MSFAGQNSNNNARSKQISLCTKQHSEDRTGPKHQQAHVSNDFPCVSKSKVQI